MKMNEKNENENQKLVSNTSGGGRPAEVI